MFGLSLLFLKTRKKRKINERKTKRQLKEKEKRELNRHFVSVLNKNKSTQEYS